MMSCAILFNIMYTTVSILIDSFLEKFPYCLPSMFAAFLCAVGVIAVGFLLPDKPEKPDKV